MRYAFYMSTEPSPNENETIFDKIFCREAPANIVYEDEHTLAFLDITPNTPGHTLVIPKKHFKNIFDIDAETLAAVMETVRKVAPVVRDAVGAKGVHINSNHEAAAGQVVFHLHFHIIPRHDRSEFEFWPKVDYAPGEADVLAEKIRERIAKQS
jgi:histidine triad (HIT) family protein